MFFFIILAPGTSMWSGEMKSSESVENGYTRENEDMTPENKMERRV